MLIEAGITKVKCATIAEAEMLAHAGMPDVLLAYQAVGPKIIRLLELNQKYPGTHFSSLIDNLECARALSRVAASLGLVADVYIDLNVGMNRTGILPNAAEKLWDDCQNEKGIRIVGLHAYDGHLRDVDLSIRTKRCDEAFQEVEALQQKLNPKSATPLVIVAGGTPTYSIHSKRKTIECSPGTFIYWDKGYEQILQEQQYLHAAVVVTRVISKPASDIICVDLGHKSIASENSLANRVHFLNLPDAEAIGHSEEHMVLRIKTMNPVNVGDVLYGIPFHVCPTVALHDRAYTVVEKAVTGYWSTLSRNRFITV